MILSWHFNFVCWSTLLLSIVDPKAHNELWNPLKKNLSDMLLETKLYKVIRLTAICDHIAILCNWVLLQIAAFCMCIYEFECWTKYWKTQHIRSCYDSIEGTIFFEPFDVFQWHTVMYCWLLRGSLGYIPMEIRDWSNLFHLKWVSLSYTSLRIDIWFNRAIILTWANQCNWTLVVFWFNMQIIRLDFLC